MWVVLLMILFAIPDRCLSFELTLQEACDFQVLGRIDELRNIRRITRSEKPLEEGVLARFLSRDCFNNLREVDFGGQSNFNDNHLLIMARLDSFSRVYFLNLTNTRTTKEGLKELVRSDVIGRNRDMQQFFTVRPSQARDFFNGLDCMSCSIIYIKTDHPDHHLDYEDADKQLTDWWRKFRFRFDEPMGLGGVDGVKVLYINDKRPLQLQ